MADGQSSAPAPELVAADFRLELAPILHPRMAALIVQANRLNHATRTTVLQVSVIGVAKRLVGMYMLCAIVLLMM